MKRLDSHSTEKPANSKAHMSFGTPQLNIPGMSLWRQPVGNVARGKMPRRFVLQGLLQRREAGRNRENEYQSGEMQTNTIPVTPFNTVPDEYPRPVDGPKQQAPGAWGVHHCVASHGLTASPPPCPPHPSSTNLLARARCRPHQQHRPRTVHHRATRCSVQTR